MKSFSNYIVDSGAIRHNILEFKKRNAEVKICAVVKANGYGHGVKNFVLDIDDLVDCYAVACFIEAKNLRKYTKKDILILNYVDVENLEQCANESFTISIFNKNQAKEIVEKSKCCINVHMAINTGMNRIGVSNITEMRNILKTINKHGNKIKLKGIYTHIYNFISNKDTEKQICIFNKFIEKAKQCVDIKSLCLHTSASSASLKYDYTFDMVRLGLLLYGYLDFDCKIDLKKTLKITSKIININKIKRGQSVGYGKNFVATKDMSIATIPLGYADGIMRNYAQNGSVIIGNQFCKIVGNICMDMFMCDVTNTKCNIGDEVIVIGSTKDLKIDAEDIAKACNTISYEILTNIKQNRFNVVKVKN